MKKRFFLLMLSAITVISLCGCGKSDNELSQYRQEVEKFYEEVSQINDNINSIDAEKENAPDKLLSELDALNAVFQDFADVDVPDEYMAAESLADEAASFMNEAVSMYHSSFSEGTFNEFSSSMAYDKYCRAILRINYIGDLLQGKPLEGEGVNVYYE